MKESSAKLILYVDDEPDFPLSISQVFRDEYVFEAVETIDQMWGKLRSPTHYDLLMLDLKLDDTDNNVGLTLLPNLQTEFPDLPVLVVTIENDPEVVFKAVELGAKGFLYKGKYNKDKWHQKISEALHP